MIGWTIGGSSAIGRGGGGGALSTRGAPPPSAPAPPPAAPSRVIRCFHAVSCDCSSSVLASVVTLVYVTSVPSGCKMIGRPCQLRRKSSRGASTVPAVTTYTPLL